MLGLPDSLVDQNDRYLYKSDISYITEPNLLHLNLLLNAKICILSPSFDMHPPLPSDFQWDHNRPVLLHYKAYSSSKRSKGELATAIWKLRINACSSKNEMRQVACHMRKFPTTRAWVLDCPDQTSQLFRRSWYPKWNWKNGDTLPNVVVKSTPPCNQLTLCKNKYFSGD